MYVYKHLRQLMNNYLVGFNNDGILIEEPITANNKDEAKVKAQPLHPDLSIIFVKWLKQGGTNG